MSDEVRESGVAAGPAYPPGHWQEKAQLVANLSPCVVGNAIIADLQTCGEEKRRVYGAVIIGLYRALKDAWPAGMRELEAIPTPGGEGREEGKG